MCDFMCEENSVTQPNNIDLSRAISNDCFYNFNDRMIHTHTHSHSFSVWGIEIHPKNMSEMSLFCNSKQFFVVIVHCRYMFTCYQMQLTPRILHKMNSLCVLDWYLELRRGILDKKTAHSTLYTLQWPGGKTAYLFWITYDIDEIEIDRASHTHTHTYIKSTIGMMMIVTCLKSLNDDWASYIVLTATILSLAN